MALAVRSSASRLGRDARAHTLPGLPLAALGLRLRKGLLEGLRMRLLRLGLWSWWQPIMLMLL